MVPQNVNRYQSRCNTTYADELSKKKPANTQATTSSVTKLALSLKSRAIEVRFKEINSQVPLTTALIKHLRLAHMCK